MTDTFSASTLLDVITSTGPFLLGEDLKQRLKDLGYVGSGMNMVGFSTYEEQQACANELVAQGLATIDAKGWVTATEKAMSDVE